MNRFLAFASDFWQLTKMTRSFLTLIAVISSLNAAEPIELFNGKDLSGWTFDLIDPESFPEAVWSISEGHLICSGRPPGVIRTEADYQNYELTVEWRWPVGKKPGNSGVLVHASKPREVFAWPKSLEIQLRAGDAGDFWMIGESVSVPGNKSDGRRWQKLAKSAEKPVGEWNVMKIRCENDRIHVEVNGTVMNHGVGLTASKGAICLQSEGSEIHFRKVILTPLPASVEISKDSR